MQWEEVETWLKEREKEEEESLTKSPPRDPSLDYAKPGDQFRYNVIVRSGGVLEKLKKVSKALSRRYRWQEGQATAFVLAEDERGNPLVPPVSLISARIDNTTDDKTPQSAKWRISMTIDPTLDPKQVANAYRQVRGRFFRKDKRGYISHKPPREKTLEPAQFYARQPENLKAKELMTRWNMKHRGGELEYKKKPFRFKRDCERAKGLLDKLVNPEFESLDIRAKYRKKETVSLKDWKRRPLKD